MSRTHEPLSYPDGMLLWRFWNVTLVPTALDIYYKSKVIHTWPWSTFHPSFPHIQPTYIFCCSLWSAYTMQMPFSSSSKPNQPLLYHLNTFCPCVKPPCFWLHPCVSTEVRDVEVTPASPVLNVCSAWEMLIFIWGIKPEVSWNLTLESNNSETLSVWNGKDKCLITISLCYSA